MRNFNYTKKISLISTYYVETRADNSGYTNHRVICLVVIGSSFDSEEVFQVSKNLTDPDADAGVTTIARLFSLKSRANNTMFVHCFILALLQSAMSLYQTIYVSIWVIYHKNTEYPGHVPSITTFLQFNPYIDYNKDFPWPLLTFKKHST